MQDKKLSFLEESFLSESIYGFFYSLFGKENINNFEGKLFLNNFIVSNFKKFILISLFSGGIFSIIIMLLLFYMEFSLEKFLIAGFLALFVPLLIFYLVEDLIFEKNKRKKEELLPELLLEVSVFIDNISITKTIEKIAEMDFVLISNDFSYINNQIKSGKNIEETINKIKELNKSRELGQFFDVLIRGYNSGFELGKILNEMAEENLQNKAIIKERQAVMIVTKYTLILASVLIVPTILGLIITLVGGFSSSFSQGLDIGLSQIEREELFNMTVTGVNIYIIEYALISAFFLSLQEGNKKNFIIYSLVLLPLALLFFYIGTII